MELHSLRLSKERVEEEARQERVRLQSEYSSTCEGRVGEVESVLRKTRLEMEQLREEKGYLERDLSKCKLNLSSEHERNLDLQREHLQQSEVRQRLEGNLLDLSAEFERYRQGTQEQGANEQAQREALRGQVGEIKGRLEQVSGELQ
jgi:cupin superfamily acireductone dioxygenase involved in methionine salvage